jgi:nucleotide-binding universal stress UspA family protein
MKPFQTILFAADFSGNSLAAFRSACPLMREGQTRLHVLHVIEPDWIPEEPAALGQAVQFSDAGRNGGRDEDWNWRMHEIYAPDRSVEVEYYTRRGDPATEILRLADRIGADLIVMGTHGRTGSNRLLAGSVATSVLRQAHCSVLTVRSSGPRRLPPEPQVLLHPTDFSVASEGALRVARWLARNLGAKLVLLHVAPLDAYLSHLAVPEDPRVYREALDDLRRRVDGPDLRYPVEARVCRGNVALEIVRIGGELECSLIVMGTHGRTGLVRLLMGSKAEAVLPRAGCPVLAVRASRGEAAPTPDRALAEARLVP